MKDYVAFDLETTGYPQIQIRLLKSVYFLIRVPALVFQPIVTAYIPKAMIDCIEKGVTTRQLILVVALLSLLLTITIGWIRL